MSQSDVRGDRVERTYLNTTARDADTFDYRHRGMVVFTQADGKLWQLNAALSWEEIMTEDTNAANIATNTTNIATNAAGIATNVTAIATNTTAIAAHLAHLTSAEHVVPLPIGSWVEVDGTPLAAFVGGVSTTPGWELTASEAWGIRWNNDAAPDPIAQSIILPNSLDDSAAIVVHVLAAKTGATLADAVTFDIGAFFQTVGALYDADANAGGATSAMTGDATAKTVQEVTRTIAAGDVPAAPCALTVTLQPTDGTLGTDDVIVIAVWLEITTQLLT